MNTQIPTPIQPVVIDEESIHYNTYLMKKDTLYTFTWKGAKMGVRVHNNLVEVYSE